MNLIMKVHASIVALAACVALGPLAGAGAAPDALYTIYEIHGQRTPDVVAFRAAVQQSVKESEVARRAVARIEERARAALRTSVALQPIDVPLGAARSNNRVNRNAAAAVRDLAAAYRAGGDRQYFEGAAQRFDAFVSTFDPARVTFGVHSNHQYHALYARDWLLPLAQAYDLLRGGLGETHRQRFGGWLRAMTIVIARENVWQAWNGTTHGAWHVAALGAVGSALQRPHVAEPGGTTRALPVRTRTRAGRVLAGRIA